MNVSAATASSTDAGMSGEKGGAERPPYQQVNYHLQIKQSERREMGRE